MVNLGFVVEILLERMLNLCGFQLLFCDNLKTFAKKIEEGLD